MLEAIAGQLPELQKIEQTVSDLERQHGEAQARVQGLALKANQAREDDLNREAAALNAGRKVPKTNEPQLREQLEDAERNLEVLERRLALAGAERARYLAEHQGEILGLLEEAHAAHGERVAAAASEALEALEARHKAEDEAAALKRLHPAPAPENTHPPESTTVVLGRVTTRNVTGGPPRGTLEGTLRHLIGMGEDTIVGAVEEDAEGAA
jgi:hypothetical protein